MWENVPLGIWKLYIAQLPPEPSKTCYMLSSTEHEISTAHKLQHRQIKKFLV